MTRTARWPLLAALALGCAGLVTGLGACGAFGASETAPPEEAGSTAEDAREDKDLAVAADGSLADASPVDAGADAGDGHPEGGCRGVAACPRWVFVTSETYGGDDFGGAISADGRCTNVAALPRTVPRLRGLKFKAWVSDDSAQGEAASRLTHGTQPYHLADGTQIATTWAQLTSGSLFHAIDRDETNAVVAPTFVWTGTTTLGTRTLSTCTGWTIGSQTPGTVGRTGALDSTWTNSGTIACGTPYGFYCIEE